jgi:hypothetical protein
MNPDLTLDELNVVMQQHTMRLNNTPLADFCGLSPNQMQSWMSGHFDAWQAFQIAVPASLQASPVMRYLALMLDEAQRWSDQNHRQRQFVGGDGENCVGVTARICRSGAKYPNLYQ